MSNEDATIISLAAYSRQQFELEINAEARIYNLMPSDEPDRTYWSQHTEMAWKVWRKAFMKGRHSVGHKYIMGS